MRPMSRSRRLVHNSYSESEAAAALGITISRLHQLLDQHIFTDGNQRPNFIEFTASDLLLLRYWSQEARPSEVIEMPKRS